MNNLPSRHTGNVTRHDDAAAPWQAVLGAGQVRTIAPSRQPRWLRLAAGRAWLTRTTPELHQAGADEDVWLDGEGAASFLRPGSAWVVEGTQASRIELLLAPPATGAQAPGPLAGARRN